MTVLSCLINATKQLPEPVEYHGDISLPSRWQVQNLLVFLRRSSETLQQRNFSNQYHARHVLLVVLETAGILHLDGQAIRLLPGESILIRPYQFHHYSDLESPVLSWLFITFDLNSGEATLECLRHQVVSVPERGLARLERIIDASGGNRPSAEVLLPEMDALLGELVLATASATGDGIVRSSRPDSWFSRVEGELRQGLFAGRSLAEISGKLGLSERHLRQRFKQEAGITLRDYRINHQLHRAVSLMRRPEISLKTIAGLSGFRSPQAFSRFFRNVTGVAARDYRERLFSGRATPHSSEIPPKRD